jgi:hypothetical protein
VVTVKLLFVAAAVSTKGLVVGVGFSHLFGGAGARLYRQYERKKCQFICLAFIFFEAARVNNFYGHMNE